MVERLLLLLSSDLRLQFSDRCGHGHWHCVDCVPLNCSDECIEVRAAQVVSFERIETRTRLSHVSSSTDHQLIQLRSRQ